jgi:hypothetical protein
MPAPVVGVWTDQGLISVSCLLPFSSTNQFPRAAQARGGGRKVGSENSVSQHKKTLPAHSCARRRSYSSNVLLLSFLISMPLFDWCLYKKESRLMGGSSSSGRSTTFRRRHSSVRGFLYILPHDFPFKMAVSKVLSLPAPCPARLRNYRRTRRPALNSSVVDSRQHRSS